MWILIALSVFAVTLIVERLLYFNRNRFDPVQGFNRMRALAKSGDWDAATRYAKSQDNPMGRLFTLVLANLHLTADELSDLTYGAILEEKLLLQPTTHWVDVLNEKGIPTGDIYGLEKALLQPQSLHRRVIETVKEEGIGDIKLFNLTAKFSKTPAQIDAPPPRLSAHSGAILKELGYKEEEIKAFKEKGAI